MINTNWLSFCRLRRVNKPSLWPFLLLTIAWVLPYLSWAGQTEFNVMDFGAKNDGSEICTSAIQAAIDACHKSGGGYTVFPPGQYLTGTILLKDNVYLKISPNATILGSKNIADYDPKVLIYAKDAKNIGIIGPGYINGQGDVFWRGKQRPYDRPESTIEFYNCQNAIIREVNIRNSAAFNIALENCDRVSITGVSIINDREAPNTDGIDPISSSNVFISNCYIETGDDAICAKSRDDNKACENLLVSNCVLISDDSAIKFGTGSRGTIRHCLFSNIVIRNTQYGIGFYMKDGGSFEDIQFSNISIETTEPDYQRPDRGTGSYPIFMDIERRDEESELGTIRNVIFSDITINTVDGNCLFSGMPEQRICDLTLNNIRMRVKNPTDLLSRHKPRGTRTLTNIAPNDYAHVSSHFTFVHVDGLNLRDLVIEDETQHRNFPRHALWALDVHHVNIEGFRQHQTADDQTLPVFKFTECHHVSVRGCTPNSANVPFLELAGPSSKEFCLFANDLTRVKTSVKFTHGASKNSVVKIGNREK